MASEPKSAGDAERLPFEPGRKKAAKASKPEPKPAEKAPAEKSALIEKRPTAAKSSPKPSVPKRSRQNTEQTAPIPAVVSRRMARRMAVFCGIPTSLGILTFVVSYLIVTHGIKLPNAAVVLVSMGFFGLGVLGLTYGILSACWDEERSGSLIGAEEFSTNFGRLRAAWKEAREQSRQTREN